MNFFKKYIFVNFDFRNEVNRYYLVTLPFFVMFPPHTSDIQNFRFKHFLQKILKFQ